MQWNKGGSEGGFEVNTMTSAQHVKVLGCILFMSIFFGLFLEKFTDAALPLAVTVDVMRETLWPVFRSMSIAPNVNVFMLPSH